jgi:FlaA1/EpsC-like NDP-sugar epimerase
VAYKSLPLVGFKPDLRSPDSTTIQKGITIRFLRIITLILFDVVSLASAWNLAVYYGTPVTSPWTEHSSFQLLILMLDIGIIATKGLYKAGTHRRNYIGLFNAVSLGAILLVFIAFLYEPTNYISRSTFLLFWCLSLIFIGIERFLFDIGTQMLRSKGAIRYPVFLITDSQDQENHVR